MIDFISRYSSRSTSFEIHDGNVLKLPSVGIMSGSLEGSLVFASDGSIILGTLLLTSSQR